ncbi:MAG: hypothetical protein ABL903_08540 [Methylococcales bacterium]
MKLAKTLTIANKTYELVAEEVWLDANSAGRASFTVDTLLDEIKPFQAVALDIGYTQHGHESRLFMGYIESATPKDRRQSVLFCREFVGVLANPLPLNLRHPTLRDVLTAVYDKSGVNFALPDAPYAQAKIPHFANIGSGYHALMHIGIAFKVADYFWQQQANGVVFVGSWHDSAWPDRDIDLPDDWFTDQYSQSGQIPALPSLRPGAVVNGQRVKSLRFQGNFMTVGWV